MRSLYHSLIITRELEPLQVHRFFISKFLFSCDLEQLLLISFLVKEETLEDPEAARPSGVRESFRKVARPVMSWGGIQSLLEPDSDMTTLDWVWPFLTSIFSCRDFPVRE